MGMDLSFDKFMFGNIILHHRAALHAILHYKFIPSHLQRVRNSIDQIS